MRLLRLNDHGELSLTENMVGHIPSYAILSHTWRADADEVFFDDLGDGSYQKQAGYAKIRLCGQQAQKDGLEYFWVDTCCIRKTDRAELSDAISSMFRWYRDAARCYVYLSDVPAREEHNTQEWENQFQKSRWFKRGWTLQELLAPKQTEFYSRDWKLLGDTHSLEQLIHQVTKIPITVLRGTPIFSFTVEERLRWTVSRRTTKDEDRAYCLMGVLDAVMPVRYGEGAPRAFTRLIQNAENFVHFITDIDFWIRKVRYRLMSPPDEQILSKDPVSRAAKTSHLDVPMNRFRVELVECAHELPPFLPALQRPAPAQPWKPPIPLMDIFNLRKDRDGHQKQPRRVFIREPLGERRIALCKKIVYDFIYAGMWTDLFSRVLWIPMFRLRSSSRRIVVTYNVERLLRNIFFLQHDDPDLAAALLWNAIQNPNSGQTLFVLDYQEDDFVDQLFEDPVYELIIQCPNVIVTTGLLAPYTYINNANHLDSFDIELSLETLEFDSSQDEECPEKTDSKPSTP